MLKMLSIVLLSRMKNTSTYFGVQTESSDHVWLVKFYSVTYSLLLQVSPPLGVSLEALVSNTQNMFSTFSLLRG